MGNKDAARKHSIELDFFRVLLFCAVKSQMFFLLLFISVDFGVGDSFSTM